jgi:hypothetical protein
VSTADPRVVPALVGAVRSAVGDRPVLVLGSRAIGNATAESDLDAYVVVPGWRIPRDMRRLQASRERLERELGIPVSLNPLPAARLRRARGAMLPFKLRREGVVAWSPAGWRLAGAGTPPVDTAARRSYAMSGVLFLLKAGKPVAEGSERLDPEAAHLTEKALLHSVQLVLAAQDKWCSTLPEAVVSAGGDWPALAGAVRSPATWIAARDRLVVVASEHREGRFEALARSLQWSALRTLQGRPSMPPLLRPSPTMALARAACELIQAVAPGRIDPGGVDRARAALPSALRRGAPYGWRGLCNLIEDEWPNASPLGGL